MSNVMWAHLWPVINLVGLGVFTSLAVTGFMVGAGLGDEANSRSNHSGVIPSAGGVGIVAAFGVCTVALALLHPSLLEQFPANFAQILSLIFAIGLLGLFDDLFDLPARFKFAIMIIISGLGVWLVGVPRGLPLTGSLLILPPIIGFLGAMLWVFVIMNAVNFMDGSNGIVTNMMMIASFALGIIGLSQGAYVAVFLCGVLVVGFLGFMPYNHREKAKVFLGDAGSLTAGFVFAIASLVVSNQTESASLLYLGPLLILPILTDVFLTLASRARRKERLMDAHRDHLYQRLITHGWSHLSVAWFYGIASLMFANVAIFAMKGGYISSPAFFALNIVTLSAFFLMVSRIIRKAETS